MFFLFFFLMIYFQMNFFEGALQAQNNLKVGEKVCDLKKAFNLISIQPPSSHLKASMVEQAVT